MGHLCDHVLALIAAFLSELMHVATIGGILCCLIGIFNIVGGIVWFAIDEGPMEKGLCSIGNTSAVECLAPLIMGRQTMAYETKHFTTATFFADNGTVLPCNTLATSDYCPPYWSNGAEQEWLGGEKKSCYRDKDRGVCMSPDMNVGPIPAIFLIVLGTMLTCLSS